MNAGNQTILHIKAGQLAPQDMLEFIVGKKPNAVGYVVQESDGKPLDVVQEDGANLTVEDMSSVLVDAKDLNRSLYFAHLGEGHHPEDVQPFVIDDPDGNKFLSIMLEGDIVGNNADKVHTEQYNYVNGVLIPQIVEICEDFEGDIERVMAKLRKETFNSNFLMHVGHRAVLHFMPFKGEPLMLAKNELHVGGDWGWFSQLVGFEKAKQEPVVAAAPARRGWGKPKASNPPGVHSTEATPVKANADKPTLSVVPKVEAKKDKPLSEQMAIRPPSWLHKNDDIKAFYQILTGEIHSQWKKKIPIIPTQNLDLLKVANQADFQDYAKRWKMENALKTSGGNTVQTKQERLSSTATPPPPADNPPKLPEQPIHGPVDPTPLPIIEAKDLQKVLDVVATLDHNSKEMMDPKEIQKTEGTIPPFTEQVGLKGLEETMNWKVSDLFAIAATDPRAMVLFALQWRAYARPYLQAEIKAKKKDNVTMTTETKTTDLGNGSTKVESVSRPARGKWGKRAA